MKVVIVTLLSTLSIQLGYFFWKLAAPTLPIFGKASFRTALIGFITHPKWLLGLACTTLGWLLFIKATDLGEISVVQPLMSVGDLFLVLLAVVFLHERLLLQEWIGLAVTVAGAILLSFDAHVIIPTRIDWPTLFVLLSLITVMGLAIYFFGLKSSLPEIPLAIAVGFAFGIGAVLTELMTAYLSLSGKEVESSALVINPVLPFMIGANVVGLFLLQIAFQKGRAAVIIPVQLSVVNGIVVIVGILVFAEAVSLLRFAAISLMIAGTLWLHLGDDRKARRPIS